MKSFFKKIGILFIIATVVLFVFIAPSDTNGFKDMNITSMLGSVCCAVFGIGFLILSTLRDGAKEDRDVLRGFGRWKW